MRSVDPDDLSFYHDTVWREKRSGREGRHVKVVFVGVHPDTIGVQVIRHRDPKLIGRTTYMSERHLLREYVRVDQ